MITTRDLDWSLDFAAVTEPQTSLAMHHDPTERDRCLAVR